MQGARIDGRSVEELLSRFSQIHCLYKLYVSEDEIKIKIEQRKSKEVLLIKSFGKQQPF